MSKYPAIQATKTTVTVETSDYVFYEITRDSVVMFERPEEDESKKEPVSKWEISWDQLELVLYVYDTPLGQETWYCYPHSFARDLDRCEGNFSNPTTVKKIKSFWQQKRQIFGQTFYRHTAKKPDKFGWRYRYASLSKDGAVYMTLDDENGIIYTRSRQKGNREVPTREWNPKWDVLWDEAKAKELIEATWKGVSEVWPTEYA